MFKTVHHDKKWKVSKNMSSVSNKEITNIYSKVKDFENNQKKIIK